MTLGYVVEMSVKFPDAIWYEMTSVRAPTSDVTLDGTEPTTQQKSVLSILMVREEIERLTGIIRGCKEYERRTAGELGEDGLAGCGAVQLRRDARELCVACAR